jgi:hypothetical protein
MNRMQRCYTRNQNQLAAFPPYDVGGSRQQVAGDAVGDLAKATPRAGVHDHTDRQHTSTRHRGREFADPICHIREPPDVVHLQIRLVRARDFNGRVMTRCVDGQSCRPSCGVVNNAATAG